jgi:four helix bundle protein
MADFKRLPVWEKAHALALNVHRVVSRLRGAPYLSVRSQLIRSAMSMPANIVEGREQASEREFVRFLRIALASSSELEYHLLVARDIGAIGQSDFISLFDQTIEARRMLHGLIKRIELGPAATQSIAEPSSKWNSEEEEVV